MSNALKIYHSLPPAARNAVASLRGYYLNWWRYDARTEKLVEEALERDFWGPDKWRMWQEERLGFLLERAATKVPFYKRYWEERRQKGDKASWSYLENWPILEKETLRANPKEFVAEDCARSSMFHDHTSGTTGSSLDIWLSRDTVKQWYALLEARSRRWYGISRKDRWAIFGGQLVAPVAQQSPPYWVWNAGLRQLYLSSYHIAPEFTSAYLDAIVKYRVRYLLGYPSAIFTLARECIDQGLTHLKLEVVVTNAEPVYDYQREIIEEAFNCPVRETYGMSEIAAAGSECENGSLHQWPDTGLIEAVPRREDDPADFICTGLLNVDMPLIRYKVGDSGRLANDACACGRSLPLIEHIDGRIDDILYALDGRRVGRMDPVFKRGLGLREAQIIQESLGLVVVKYVRGESFQLSALDELAARIQDRLGRIQIEFEEVDAIPRTSRGKFRAVVCNVEGEGSYAGS